MLTYIILSWIACGLTIYFAGLLLEKGAYFSVPYTLFYGLLGPISFYIIYKHLIAKRDNKLKDQYITTFTGKRFYFLSPTPSSIDIESIAECLSKVCRFGGHCNGFYSVAEHSVLVMLIAQIRYKITDKSLLLKFLLHDATEAYVGDMVSPLKYAIPEFKAIENLIWKAAIAPAFGLTEELPAIIKKADNEAFLIEKDYLKGKYEQPKEQELKILCLSPSMAKHEFLAHFSKLVSGGPLEYSLQADPLDRVGVGEKTKDFVLNTRSNIQKISK